METKRCEFCGVWFEPSPRLGDRQRACSEKECQGRRHAVACCAWREKNPVDRAREARRLKQYRGAHADELKARRRAKARWEAELAAQRTRRRRVRDAIEVVRDAIVLQMTDHGGVAAAAPAPGAGDVVRDAIAVERLVLLGLAAMTPVPAARDVVRDEIDRRLLSWHDLGRSIVVRRA